MDKEPRCEPQIPAGRCIHRRCYSEEVGRIDHRDHEMSTDQVGFIKRCWENPATGAADTGKERTRPLSCSGEVVGALTRWYGDSFGSQAKSICIFVSATTRV